MPVIVAIEAPHDFMSGAHTARAMKPPFVTASSRPISPPRHDFVKEVSRRRHAMILHLRITPADIAAAYHEGSARLGANSAHLLSAYDDASRRDISRRAGCFTSIRRHTAR